MDRGSHEPAPLPPPPNGPGLSDKAEPPRDCVRAPGPHGGRLQGGRAAQGPREAVSRRRPPGARLSTGLIYEPGSRVPVGLEPFTLCLGSWVSGSAPASQPACWVVVPSLPGDLCPQHLISSSQAHNVQRTVGISIY